MCFGAAPVCSETFTMAEDPKASAVGEKCQKKRQPPDLPSGDSPSELREFVTWKQFFSMALRGEFHGSQPGPGLWGGIKLSGLCF
jgi:hypothetical protein